MVEAVGEGEGGPMSLHLWLRWWKACYTHGMTRTDCLGRTSLNILGIEGGLSARNWYQDWKPPVHN